MTSISAVHNSTALILLKDSSSDQKSQDVRSLASQILSAASANGLMPDTTDTSGKITRILLESGQLIIGAGIANITGTDGDDIIILPAVSPLLRKHPNAP